MVNGQRGQVVTLYRNDCMGIGLGGLNVGRLRRMVVLERWRGGCLNKFDCMHYRLSNIEHLIGQCLKYHIFDI